MKIRTLFEKYIKLRKKLDQAKIYKIIDNTNDNIYIGSTCMTLKKRLQRHESSYKMFLKGLCSNTRSFDILKNNRFEIMLLEDCNIKTEEELKARERFFIENNECTNKNVPGRTRKEYQNTYYENNKEKYNEQRKEKFECSCGSILRISDKSAHLKTKKHINYLNSII